MVLSCGADVYLTSDVCDASDVCAISRLQDKRIPMGVMSSASLIFARSGLTIIDYFLSLCMSSLIG